MPELDRAFEPGLFELAAEFARSSSRWYGQFFMAIILIYAGLGLWCGVRFFAAADPPEMIRWGLGLLLCWTAVIGAKIWYWLLLNRLALTREIRRLEAAIARRRERPA